MKKLSFCLAKKDGHAAAFRGRFDLSQALSRAKVACPPASARLKVAILKPEEPAKSSP
jgi:hypothetical protein